jgi:predicted nucleotidyltransferase component of viral defense system
MIPRDFVTAWRQRAPWTTDRQVEQDLVISRALVEIYRRPGLQRGLAFRGGTALYKLHVDPPARYSEDIDLVQTEAGPIGATIDEIRLALDGWLGEPRRSQGPGRVTLHYRFDSEEMPSTRMRLKVEINSREQFTLLGHEMRRFAVDSRWFAGATEIRTFMLDELLATKLRALYQRRKGRDLFDLAHALALLPTSPERIVAVFGGYMQANGAAVTRAMFERNLAAKRLAPTFVADLSPLLAPGNTWDPEAALDLVHRELVSRLPGEPWRRS